MGMLIDGQWEADTDRFMQDGTFQREPSALSSDLSDTALNRLRDTPEAFILVASASCPWSHGAVLASIFKGFSGRLPIQWAGGPRVQGYGLQPHGPLAESGTRHIHTLYSATDPAYTGRATVPVLWDLDAERILSNSSADLIDAFDRAGTGPSLCPDDRRPEIEALTRRIFDGLSNAVYRAGLAERQDAYDDAVDTVFDTLDMLEARLANTRYLFGDWISSADLRLFATLVRFDAVYATHFRCTRRRIVDYAALWRFTRRIYQQPGIRDSVDFDEIRFGYYVNDGSHNPHGIIGQQPLIDWDDATGLD